MAATKTYPKSMEALFAKVEKAGRGKKPASKQSKTELTLSQILAGLQDNVDWKIIDSHHAKLKTQDATGEVYWDDQDPEQSGWAYRITIYAREADDFGVRHPVREESGIIDTPSDLSSWFGPPKAKKQKNGAARKASVRKAEPAAADELQTFKANLKRAAFNREQFELGGGQFDARDVFAAWENPRQPESKPTLQTFAANLKHAAFNRQQIEVGGGLFGARDIWAGWQSSDTPGFRDAPRAPSRAPGPTKAQQDAPRAPSRGPAMAAAKKRTKTNKKTKQGGKPDREVIAWALARAEEAGVHSVKKVSGPDVLRLCALAKAPSNKTVQWCRQRAEAAGDGSVQQISGVDLAALARLAKAGQVAANAKKPKRTPKAPAKAKKPSKKSKAPANAPKKPAKVKAAPSAPIFALIATDGWQPVVWGIGSSAAAAKADAARQDSEMWREGFVVVPVTAHQRRRIKRGDVTIKDLGIRLSAKQIAKVS